MYGQSKHVVGGLKRASWILVTLAFVLLATTTNPGHSAVSNPQENVNLYTGNRLVISSNQPAIQSVFVRGNVSAAGPLNTNYPDKNFTLTTNSTQLYTLDIWLSYPSSYTTRVIINDPSADSVPSTPPTTSREETSTLQYSHPSSLHPLPEWERPSPGLRSTDGSSSSATPSPSGSRYSTRSSEHSSPS